MKFRPCIDIHNGVVKQIVGSSLTEDKDDNPIENFIATKPSEFYASKYQQDGLQGGHLIMLGPSCEEATMRALQAYPRGLQVGGGITIDNAMNYLDAGASHVIVTSYVFQDGHIDFDRLKQLSELVSKDRLVIDLSCRRKINDSSDTGYYVVTNKWTKFTDYPVNLENLYALSQYCAEFLIHGVDVEGKKAGIEEPLVELLGNFSLESQVPITYAGGIRSLVDMELVKRLGRGVVDCTVGSALDMFGGDLSYDDVVQWSHKQDKLLG